ncbi:MAG: hypothetical protein D6714_05945 [Bacteroidetes bacterium]|nr:MAG: hypothetical protein D6714_05945 [Bacteroidota bacterium]
MVFAGKFFLSYILLIVLVLSLGLNKSYSNWFANRCDGIFGDFFSVAQIHAASIEKTGDSKHDIQFQIYSQQTIKKARAEAKLKGQNNVNVEGVLWTINAERVSLMPLLFLLALIIAYPAPIKRKFMSAALALGLFFLFQFFFMMAALMFKMHEDPVFFADYSMPDFFARFIENLLRTNVETSFLIVFLIWGVAMIRTEDFKKLLAAN